jgi:SAM-dependent methyltransferase
MDRLADLAIANECRLNVLWWHAAARGDRALEIEVPSLTLTPGLAALYRQVERVPLADLDEAAAHGTLPFASGTFDLVTLYGHCPPRIALIELRRVLSSNGTLLLAAGNGWWNGRWRGGSGLFPGRPANLGVLKSLRRAGFAMVSGYWVEPSLAIPRNLIPVARGRARQFEAIRAREWGGGDLRLALVSSGLAALLYPALLVVARASETGPDGQP